MNYYNGLVASVSMHSVYNAVGQSEEVVLMISTESCLKTRLVKSCVSGSVGQSYSKSSLPSLLYSMEQTDLKAGQAFVTF